MAENRQVSILPHKPKQLRSAVWKDFTRTDEEGIQRATCNHCKISMDCNSKMGTSRLKNHLKTCPKRPNLESGQQRLLISGNKEGTPTVTTFRFDAVKSRSDLAEAIIVHEYPFSIVNHSRFEKFVKGLRPEFNLPSRNTVRADCLRIYDNEMKKLHDILGETNGRISLTSDMWTSSCQKRGYLCLTAHYIDKSWELKKKILNFVAVDTPHTGEKLALVIKDCLLKWNIDSKIFSFTLDNCSTNDNMVKKLIDWLIEKSALVCNGNFFQVRCAAHILNLVVQDGVKEISDVIQKIRESIKYVNASPARCEIFDRAVCHVKVVCDRKLCLDVPTRWNSTFLMLDVALKYKDAFDRFQELDRHYDFAPNKEDWMKAATIKNSLQVFYEATNVISGVKYPTSSIYFKEFCSIKREIDILCLSSEIIESNMAKKMKEKFDKYWNMSNLILAVAVVFDPHYKIKLVEFYYRRLYGEEALHHIDAIKCCLFEIYDEYKAIYASNTLSTGCNDGDTSLDDVSSCKRLKTNDFNDFIQETSVNRYIKTDLELYLEEPLHPNNNPIDILTWWKINGAKYPILSKMGLDILAIPISTVASESTFSTGGRILDSYRSRLGEKTVEALICAQDWLRDYKEDVSDLPTLLPEEKKSFASAYISD